MTYALRPFRDSDSISELTALLRQAYAELALAGLNYTASYQDDATTGLRIEQGRCLVAVEGTSVVGTITVRRGGSAADPAVYRNPEWAIVNQLGVLPGHRRKGMGTALIDAAEDVARSWGCQVMALDTALPAEELRAWYERHGFQTVGTTRWAGKRYDSVIMTRPVGRAPRL